MAVLSSSRSPSRLNVTTPEAKDRAHPSRWASNPCFHTTARGSPPGCARSVDIPSGMAERAVSHEGSLRGWARVVSALGLSQNLSIAVIGGSLSQEGRLTPPTPSTPSTPHPYIMPLYSTNDEPHLHHTATSYTAPCAYIVPAAPSVSFALSAPLGLLRACTAAPCARTGATELLMESASLPLDGACLAACESELYQRVHGWGGQRLYVLVCSR